MLTLPRVRMAMAAVLTCASFAMAANAQSVTRISPGVAQGMLINAPQPQYPQMAKIAHVQGDVVLEARISKQGTIENLRAVSGPPLLIEAAMEAVRGWRYKPYILNGSPVEVETIVTVRFHM